MANLALCLQPSVKKLPTVTLCSGVCIWMEHRQGAARGGSQHVCRGEFLLTLSTGPRRDITKGEIFFQSRVFQRTLAQK